MRIRDQDLHFFETINLLVRVVFALVAVGVIVSCNSSAGVDGKPAQLRLVWHAVTQASDVNFFLGTPAVSAGVLYLEDGNTVLALDAKTGAKKWARPVRVHPVAPARNLVVRAGRVFVSET